MKATLTLEKYLWELSMSGGCDEEHGSVDEGGWFGLMRDGSTVFIDHDPFLEQLEEESREPLRNCAGVILRCDSQGFKFVVLFDTLEELETEWTAVCETEEQS